MTELKIWPHPRQVLVAWQSATCRSVYRFERQTNIGPSVFLISRPIFYCDLTKHSSIFHQVHARHCSNRTWIISFRQGRVFDLVWPNWPIVVCYTDAINIVYIRLESQLAICTKTEFENSFSIFLGNQSSWERFIRKIWNVKPFTSTGNQWFLPTALAGIRAAQKCTDDD